MCSSASKSNEVRSRTNYYFHPRTQNNKQLSIITTNRNQTMRSSHYRGRDRSRSRSRSRSPDHHRDRRDKHRDRSYRDRDRDRRRDKKEHHHNRDRDRERDNRHKSSNNDRNKLIAQRSASILRSQSVARSNAIFRSMAKPTVNNNHNHRFERKDKNLLSTITISQISMTQNISNDTTEETSRPKPRFLSRKQREELAKQKEADKKAQQREKQNEETKEREKFFRLVRESKHIHHHKKDEDNDIMMSRNKGNRNNNNNHNNKSTISRLQREELRRREHREEELQLIKDQYLGKKRQKKLIVPPSQKFKFNFDWETSEDTSEDLNELYSKRAKISFLFGRGYIAGIDRDEQYKKNEMYPKKRNVNKNIDIDDDIDDITALKLKKRRLERDRKARKKYEKDLLDARNWRDKKLNEMTERDWRILKEEFRISTKFGGRLPNPIRFWSESGLPESILKAIKEVAKYDEPYKIQRMAIPVGLSNRDCVGIAETGSGKTAAFVLPMLVYVLSQPTMNNLNFEDGPYSLVLAPTRELAKQIESETNKFATFIHISAITIVGGINHDQQSNLLRNGCEVIIATPGRLLDCIDRRILVLNQCNYVVLDEADRMIDMGFEPQVTAIFDKMPSSNLRPIDEDLDNVDNNNKMIYRQTFMFSATMPPAVERLTRKYLRNPVYITIGDPNATAAEHVKQNVIWIQEKNKRKKLQSMFENISPPIMIFVNMKKAADTLAKYLRSQSFEAISLHGGKSQENRERALSNFKDNLYDILVCTNVAGRGIDISGIKHVINYDMPSDIRDYCHRIGRTGRAGQLGIATSFLTKDDTEIMYELKKMLLKTQNVCPQELMQNEAALRNPNLPFEPKTTKQILAKVKPV